MEKLSPQQWARLDDREISDADLLTPLGDAPVPVRGGQPCPPGIAPVRLSIAETARLVGLARQQAAGLIFPARVAFALHWSVQRRRLPPNPRRSLLRLPRCLPAAFGPPRQGKDAAMS